MRTILLMFVLVLTSCTKPPTQSCKGFRHYKLPLEIHVDSSVDAMHQEAIRRAINAMEQQTGRRLITIVPVNRVMQPIARDGINGIYVLHTWEDDRKSEEGRTSLHWMAGLAIEADVRINAKDFNFHIGELIFLAPTYSINLESLYMHELFHALGMMHNEEDEKSVMYPYLGSSEYRMTMTEQDLKDFRCLYGN